MPAGLKRRILDDLTTAMKAGDKGRVGVLRMIKSEIQKQEVDARAEKGRDYELDDEEVLAVLARAAKQRRESIESFRGGRREDLAEREEQELATIESYLPEQLDGDELRKIVDQAIVESGAESARDMGRVMKVLMPKVKGRADGKLVNRMVREQLEGGGPS
jgi:uncharacterized protein YqeY